MAAAKAKTTRKKHSVKAQVQILDLTRAGSAMTFEVFANEEKLGELQLGQGTVNWIGKNRKVWGKPLTWSKFAELMNEVTYDN